LTVCLCSLKVLQIIVHVSAFMSFVLRQNRRSPIRIACALRMRGGRPAGGPARQKKSLETRFALGQKNHAVRCRGPEGPIHLVLDIEAKKHYDPLHESFISHLTCVFIGHPNLIINPV
jgi:hypothetical protein